MEGGNGHTKGVVSIEGLKDMFGVKVMPVIRHLPQITPEELNEMKRLDPKSEADPTHF
jgi:hypothetical protein